MKQKHIKKNKGYTLVEMIIVIGIMAVLTGMAFVTMRSVDNAKYKKAVSTFESELNTLRTTAMAQDESIAMKIYYDEDEGAYCVLRGAMYNGVFYPITVDAAGNHVCASGDISDSVKDLQYFGYSGVACPVRSLIKGTVTYNGVEVGTDGVVIQFKKSDGSTLAGNGSFVFYHRNGEILANVHVVKTTGLYYETYTD